MLTPDADPVVIVMSKPGNHLVGPPFVCTQVAARLDSARAPSGPDEMNLRNLASATCRQTSAVS